MRLRYFLRVGASAACLISLFATWTIAQNNDAIDWNKARQIHQKFVRGEKLTAEEQAYHDRAVKAFQAEARPGKPSMPTKLPVGLKPLCDMTADDCYKGEDGGLYGGGKNVPPEKHLQPALEAARAICPLDAAGRPVPEGKIGFISIGMSNTTQEFSVFVRLANAAPEKSPKVVIVDGAQGGMDARAWAEPDKISRPCALDPWTTLDWRLQQASVSPRQVQVAWIKQARIQPGSIGEYPKHAEEMRGYMLTILRKAHERFPNLRLAYLSNRIYAGYARTPLNPEPYAYESAFVVRRLIQDQIKGAAGAVQSPLLLWGPYLWADGEKGRKLDDLVWKPEDLGPDGTHPSGSGRRKVAELLLKFMKSDPTAKVWFTDVPGVKPAGNAETAAEAAFKKGVAEYKAGHSKASIAAYTEAIRLDRTYVDALINRGLGYHDHGEEEKAVGDFNEAIRLNPKSAMAHYGRGLVFEKNDIVRALADFDAAIRLDPKWAGTYWTRGTLFWNKGDREKAITDYSEAIRLNPDLANLRFVRGGYYHQTGELDKAITDFTDTIRLNPKYAYGYAARGLAHALKHERDEALADFGDAIRLDPKKPIFLCLRGEMYFWKDEYDRAIGDYSNAIRLDPKSGTAYKARGDAYKEMGEQAKAEADYKEAKRLGADQAGNK